MDQPELGYRLRRAAWGKGYSTEGSRALIRKGFTELGVQRVVAFTYGEHRASRRVMEKAGMRLVRTYRLTPEQLGSLGITDPTLFDEDDVEYAITKAEWEQQEAAERAPGPVKASIAVPEPKLVFLTPLSKEGNQPRRFGASGRRINGR